MTDMLSYEVPWDRTHRFDPPTIFDKLRDGSPLTRMTYPDGHIGWLAVGHDVVRSILSDPRFSHSLEIGHFPVTKFGQPVPQFPASPGMFIHMDPPDHTRYRKLLTGEFTVRRMSALAPRVGAVAAEQIAGMRASGSPVDLVATFAKPFVLRVLSELIGLPYEQRDRYAEAPTVMHDPDGDQQLTASLFGQMTEFFLELIAARRATPADDLLSRLIALPEGLTDEEICNIVTLLLFAGYETTESALAVGVFALLEHPDQLAALRADPSKIDGAVEELLRYLTVNQYEIFRTALEDVDLGGQSIAKGETVTLSLPAANRDPAKFGCPAHLDIDHSTAGHVAFGYGIHQCIGQNLARVELRSGLLALLEAFPRLHLAVPADEVPLRLKGSVFSVTRLPVSW